jgi:anti-sigma factor RsiW
MRREHPEPERVEGLGQLPPDERRAVLDHLRRCEPCREAWVARDSSRVFGLLLHTPIPAEALDRLSESVASRLDESAGAPADRPRFAWASIAASLLLAALIGGFLISRPLDRVVPGPVGSEARAGTVASGGIELLAPTGAQVYDLSVGDTRVVMIFDEELDI